MNIGKKKKTKTVFVVDFLMSVSISIKIKNEAEIFRSFYARNAINHRQSIWYTQTLAHRQHAKVTAQRCQYCCYCLASLQGGSRGGGIIMFPIKPSPEGEQLGTALS